MQECRFLNSFKNIFITLYFFAILVLLYFTPLSQSEANIVFTQNITLESMLVQNIYKFTQSAWVMRLPFFIIALSSLAIYIRVVKEYIPKEGSYFYLAVLIYLLTPGVTLTFLIINYATVPMLLTLLILFSNYRKNYPLFITASVLLLFTHSAQFVVYLAIAFYGYKEKRWWLTVFGLVFVLLASVIATYDIDGIPKGHLVQLVGIYASILSPILFLVVIYALYRSGIKGNKDLLWYIATSAFVISILLSIRQAIKITDFAPFVVLSIPLVVVVFKESLAVRLPEFRGFYYLVCKTVLFVLLLETSIIFFHYPLYKFTPFKELILDSTLYEIPFIVKELKKEGKVCKDEISNHDLNLYKFYGIDKCH